MEEVQAQGWEASDWKRGERVKVASVGLEKELLRKADALARRRGVNRSTLVSEALRALIASAA